MYSANKLSVALKWLLAYLVQIHFINYVQNCYMFRLNAVFTSLHFTYLRNRSICIVNAGKWHEDERQLMNGTSVGVESSWNVMAHGDAREGKWRENWRMEWVASTLDTTSEHGVSSITTADAHTSAASGGLNRRPRRFNP